MRRYEVIVTRRATEDISEIYEYISENLMNPLAAERVARAIWREVNILSITPFRTHIGDKYYSAHVKKYKIIYTIDGDKVIVHNVVHMRKDFRV